MTIQQRKEKIKEGLKRMWNSPKMGHAMFLILTVILIIIAYKSCNKGTIVVPENKPVVIYRDKDGKVHSQISTTEVDKQTMKILTDSIAKLIRGRNEIHEVTTYVTKIDTVFRRIPVYIDTNNNFSMEFEDNYVYIKAEGNTQNGSGDIALRGIDTITYVSQTEKHLFRANERKIDIKNTNPYIKVAAGSSITLKEPKTLITFGPSIGVTYDNGFKPTWGFAATYNLFSIKSK